ncbi:hypothetical protein C882_3255 [Caenispirillum salinarum AK4]|uniref:DUF3576 domain-containing protein n=1 Tax=Caenispirillum salinarum AK4 TaxID=1238182 RepID=K9HVE6_9PROT|nr:DUF3576 domain-containing protein [Caenispirillum salinarum]EKV32191.1 hypothetical protein C882_3255 [Caenispirillum salinarum AK4]
MKTTFSARRRTPAVRSVLVSLAAVVALAACSQTQAVFPTDKERRKNPGGTYEMQTMRESFEERETVFGQGGLNLFGDDTDSNGGGTGIGVNAWLWRATLDTVSFMPLVSADPFGGVIITDWYADPATPGERFKANAYILGRELRADGLKVTVFRQVRDPQNGGWVDAPVAPGVSTELEDAVLMRARELRMASNEG